MENKLSFEETLNLVSSHVQSYLNLSDDEINNPTYKFKIIDGINTAYGFCNVDNLPKEALYSIAMLIISDLDSSNTSKISSLSEGGRSVSFATLTAEEIRRKAFEGLNRFKRIKFL